MADLSEEKISKGWKLIFGIISIIVSAILSALLTPHITSLIVFVCGIKKDHLPVSSTLVGAFTLFLILFLKKYIFGFINQLKS